MLALDVSSGAAQATCLPCAAWLGARLRCWSRSCRGRGVLEHLFHERGAVPGELALEGEATKGLDEAHRASRLSARGELDSRASLVGFERDPSIDR